MPGQPGQSGQPTAKTDIKVMLSREWEPALLLARGAAGTPEASTMNGFITALVKRHLDEGDFFNKAKKAQAAAQETSQA